MSTTCQAPNGKVAARPWRKTASAHSLLVQMAQDAEKLAAQAERLRGLKKRERVTFREIGDAIHVTERQVQRWFAGDSEINPDNLKALAAYLNTTPDFIEYGERLDTPDLLGQLSNPDVLTRLQHIEEAIEAISARLDRNYAFIQRLGAGGVLDAIAQALDSEEQEVPQAQPRAHDKYRHPAA